MTTLTREHIEFIAKEYGVEDIDALNDNAFDDLYDKLCDREVDEVVDDETSDACRLVADVVTYMGNQYE